MKKRTKIILVFLILLLIVITIFAFGVKKNGLKDDLSDSNNQQNECLTNTDCVASSCCHATSCVSKDNAPICKNIFCSLDCSGPLDCNKAYCGCVNNKCEIVKN
jgi:hypothetical protein